MPKETPRNESSTTGAAEAKTIVATLLRAVDRKVFFSRLAERFKQWAHPLEHFCSPCLAGAATAGLLHLLDAAKPATAATDDLSEKFIKGSLEHVHMEVLLLGLFLFALCMTLMGSLAARWLRRFLVLPLIQLGHHIFLAAAGALIAFLLLPHVDVMPTAVLVQLLWGVLFLFIGGAEMQVAEAIAKMPDEEITRSLGLWPTVFLGALGAIGIGWALWKQLTLVH